MMAVFFAMASIANMAFADTNDVAAMRNGNRSYSKSGCPKKECQEVCKCPKKECKKSPSSCTCSDYLTCCPMLPLPAKCGYVTLAGEYLYWKTYTTVPYTIFRYASPPYDLLDADYTAFNAQVRTTELNAHSGYRLNLGIYFSDCSNLLATYRQYQANGTDSVSGAGVDNGIPVQERSYVDAVWMTNTPPTGFADYEGLPVSASSIQRHRENVLDIDFQKTFACNRFTYSPYVGVRFAWVKADLRVDYLYGSTSDGRTVPFTNHVDIANHMNLGVGLHSGINSNVDLGWGFGFYGKSGVAALIGQFQYEHKESVLARGTNVFVTESFPYTLTRSFKVTDFQTVWEMGVGLNWGAHFGDCGYYLGLNLGYDLNVWPNFFNAIRTAEYAGSQTPNTGDMMSMWTRSLLTHGLTVGARFDF
jgi:hypothetical protein